MGYMWKVDQILALFAPFDCLACKKEGLLLCRECQKHVPLAPGVCYSCLSPTPTALCARCCSRVMLHSAWSATTYQGVSRQLVGRLKFSRTQAAAVIIAHIITQRLPALPADSVVVHVPTANQRVRQRGYDQAQLIARELARLQQLPYQALLRRYGNSRQVGANKSERRQQLRYAYYCPHPERVAGKNILLIDDVLTTGATLEAAATTLRRNEAKTISAVVFAQKI